MTLSVYDRQSFKNLKFTFFLFIPINNAANAPVAAVSVTVAIPPYILTIIHKAIRPGAINFFKSFILSFKGGMSSFFLGGPFEGSK